MIAENRFRDVIQHLFSMRNSLRTTWETHINKFARDNGPVLRVNLVFEVPAAFFPSWV